MQEEGDNFPYFLRIGYGTLPSAPKKFLCKAIGKAGHTISK